MKKLILGSIVLSCFSLSVILFQVSCQKSANSQTNGYILPPATTSTLGGVIVGNGLTVNANGTLSTNSNSLQQINKIIYSITTSIVNYTGEIWTANYDGTGKSKVNIVLPSELGIQGQARLSPNGQNIFFVAGHKTTNKFFIYSCNLDGSNVRLIIDGSSVYSSGLDLMGAN